MTHEEIKNSFEACGQYVTGRDYALIKTIEKLIQPKRVPLTNEQIEKLFPESQSDDGLAAYWLTFARSIEATHGIKGEE